MMMISPLCKSRPFLCTKLSEQQAMSGENKQLHVVGMQHLPVRRETARRRPRAETLTSFAVLCVPTIRMKEAGCLSKVTDCQDL